MMCFLDKPTSFGPSPICPRHLLARMILSRSLRSAIHLPTMVSVLPRISGVAPSGYTSAVSKKNTPASNALSMIAKEAASSHWLPKVMVPRQISLTLRPVRPSRLIFMAAVLESLCVVGLEPLERALPAVFSRLFVEARTVVGKERVARVGVDVDARSLQLRYHVLREARVQLILFSSDLAVPGNRGFDCGLLGRIQPNDAPTPTKPGDRQLRSIRPRILFRECQRGVQVGQVLRVWHFGYDRALDLPEIRQL